MRWLIYLRLLYSSSALRVGRGTKELVGRIQGHNIAIRTKTTDLPYTDRRHDGLMAKLFALVDIRQMHLDSRHTAGGNGVADGNAVVGIGTGVNNDAIVAAECILNGRNYFPFGVALHDFDLPVKAKGGGTQGRV